MVFLSFALLAILGGVFLYLEQEDGSENSVLLLAFRALIFLLIVQETLRVLIGGCNMIFRKRATLTLSAAGFSVKTPFLPGVSIPWNDVRVAYRYHARSDKLALVQRDYLVFIMKNRAYARRTRRISRQCRLTQLTYPTKALIPKERGEDALVLSDLFFAGKSGDLLHYIREHYFEGADPSYLTFV